MLAVSLVIAVGAFWLSQTALYLPHVDDFYIFAWAKAIGDGTPLPVHALSRFYPNPDYYLNAPRLHIVALAQWINGFGFTLDSLVLFRTTMFVLTAIVVALGALRAGLPLAAVFFPTMLCITMLHSGQRPDSSALLLFATAFVLLWPSEQKFSAAQIVTRTLAKTAAVLAPLAWPSAMAYGAALLILSDLRDIKTRPLWQLIMENVIALTIGIIVLGLMVGFDFAQFLKIYSGYAREHDDLFSFNVQRMMSGAALLAAAYVVRPQSQAAAFAAAVVGFGQLIGLVLHTKFPIATPLSSLAVLSLADAFVRGPRARLMLWAATAAVVGLLLTNQAIFAMQSRPDAASAAAVKAFASQARSERRTLLVDEIAATHGLNLDVDGVYAWSYSTLHPRQRPDVIDEIAENDSWIVSTYTIHSWLKSEVVKGFPARRADTDAFLPQLPCLIGRNSCRFPKTRWGYYLVERRNGTLTVKTVP